MPLKIRAFHRASGLVPRHHESGALGTKIQLEVAHQNLDGAALVAVILIAVLALAAATSHASSPVLQGGATAALEAPTATGPLLSYQGRLVDPNTGNPKSGAFVMTFRLYDQASGGSALWTESKNVVVTNGQFSTLLGDTTALNLTVFDGRDLWLGVQVGSDLEATPRVQIAYAPYALYTNRGQRGVGRRCGAGHGRGTARRATSLQLRSGQPYP